jgi:serine/threonine protein kinase
VGTTLDRRFEVVALVAHGGFATILRGRDLRHVGRPCAIKIFRQGVLDEQWLTHRFQQEVSALEQIRHPSVVSIYGHGISPAGTPYLVLEFIEGGTLRDLLDRGALPPKRTAALLRQAAGALEQIHARGIYHRDLKPENLMLRAGAAAGEELVLIDFSIAIVKEPDQTIHGLSRAAGTIYYMAPEQAVGFATPASDIYSLAKIVFEMITGRRLSTLLPDASMDLPERVRELARRLPIPFSEESVEMSARPSSSIRRAVHKPRCASLNRLRAIWTRHHAVLQPVPAFIPKMPDLPRAQSRDFRDLFERETREVVQVYNGPRFRLSLAQLVHQQSDLDNLLPASGISQLGRSELVQKPRRPEGRALHC